MNDLLNLAIKAHGGLERWRQVRSLQARVTLNGTLWRIKGRPNGLPGVLMRADTRQPALTITPFPSPGSVGHFAPDRVWIAGENNKLVSELNKPETHSPVPCSRPSGTSSRNSTSLATHSGITSRLRSYWLSLALKSKRLSLIRRMVKPGDRSA